MTQDRVRQNKNACAVRGTRGEARSCGVCVRGANGAGVTVIYYAKKCVHAPSSELSRPALSAMMVGSCRRARANASMASAALPAVAGT